MSLPWLREDYQRPNSRSRSRSRSGSKSHNLRSEERKVRRSRSHSPRDEGRDFQPRGRDDAPRGRGGSRNTSNRSPDRNRRKRSRSSSSGSSSDSRRSPTRLVASNREKYVNARIFVANISSKDLSKAEIVTHFEKYGNVVDCLIHPKNYVFVQYLKEEHARLAVEGENGSTFNGFRINVKMANENRKPGGQSNNRENRESRDSRDTRDRSSRDPLAHNEPGRPPRDPYGPDPFIHDRRAPPPFPPGGDYRDPRGPFYPPPPPPDPYRRGYPPEPWLPPDDPYRRDPYADPYRDPYASRPLPPPAPIGPVECEVFIINTQLRTYGEIVERKVKDQSIITALSIIPEGRTAPQMVEELTVKGGLFAIFLNAQNEVHRSLTLNILHGTPQEHRNMPLDDAIGLIGRSFEKYVEELRAKTNAASTSSSSNASRAFLSPSSEVTYLLNLLADNRALTVTELDTVIKYLQERREKLIDVDKRPTLSDGKESNDKKDDSKDEVKSTHEELTKKILSIFQGVDPSIASKLTQVSSGATQVPAPQPAPAPPPPPGTSSKASANDGGVNLINFDNPNVQKALNNLIQSGPDLLKSFTSSSDTHSASTSSTINAMVVNPAPVVNESMMSSKQGIPTSFSGVIGMPNPGMDMDVASMGMYGGGQFDGNMQAALAAASMGFMSNMAGTMQAPMGGGPMGGVGGPMGGGMMPGQDFNYPPMPMGGPPPPPPPNQRY